MLRIRDRTSEFFSAVAVKTNARHSSAYHQPHAHEPALRSPLRQHGQFTAAAIQINGGIQALLSKLEKLTRLAQRKGLYDDRSAEVTELTFIIRKDLQGLTHRIGDLQSQQGQRQAPEANQSTASHRTGVVTQLQAKLAQISTDFTNVLQVSSSNMRAQRERREQFGATTSAAALLPAYTQGGASQRHQRSGTASPAPADYTAIDMPMSFQKMALAEPVRPRRAAPASPCL